MHLKTDKGEIWPNVSGVAESCFACIVLRTGDSSELKSPEYSRAVKIELGPEHLRSCG